MRTQTAQLCRDSQRAFAAATRHDTYPAPHDYFTTTRRILQAGVKCHFVTENCQEVTKVSVERKELPAIRLAREMHCRINQPENDMLGTQAHIDLINQFEKAYPKYARTSFRLDREDKSQWAAGHVYQHGPTNDAFLIYRLGYAFGVTVGRDESN